MENNINSSRRSFLKKLTAYSLSSIIGDLSAGGTGYGSCRNVHVGKFVPVMLTPYKDDLTIDFDALSRLIEFYEEAGAKGFFANCLSSEMYHLTPDERLAITSHVVKRLQGRASVVATGSFGQTIQEKVDFTQRIQDTGVDAVILISSHFVEKEENDQVFIQHLDKFLSLTGSIPLGSYECPNPYKRIISPEVYAFMVQSGRFVYHKDTSEDLEMIKTKLALSEHSSLQLYNAHSGTAVASIRAGAAGMSPISGNFYPEILAWIGESANNPDKLEDLKWIQAQIAQTEPTISNVYPISAKYFLEQRGLPINLGSRSLKKTLSEEQKSTLSDVYTRFLGWCERLNIKPVNYNVELRQREIRRR